MALHAALHREIIPVDVAQLEDRLLRFLGSPLLHPPQGLPQGLEGQAVDLDLRRWERILLRQFAEDLPGVFLKLRHALGRLP